MMVGYCLEQIPHFQGEFKQFTIRLCHVITERISVRVQLFSAFQSLTSRMT